MSNLLRVGHLHCSASMPPSCSMRVSFVYSLGYARYVYQSLILKLWKKIFGAYFRHIMGYALLFIFERSFRA
jgi:hypothetical protein